MKTESKGLSKIQWLICIVAALGFAFDTYELLMLPLILPPALQQLGGLQPGSPEFLHWRDLFFYVPAVCGGVFGLLGGYLTDRFGRRRVLVYSILVYAFSALAAGFATSLPMLLVLRCTTFVGVCVEFVAAVAWLAELFQDPKQREQVLGYTQAFSSLGGFMVSGAFVLAAKYHDSLPAIHGVHEAWRYTLISGVIPAIPLIIIRPFLPESPMWKEKKAAGTLKRPSITEIFNPRFKRTTLVSTLMVACSFAVAFGAIQQIPQIVPGLPEVAGLPRPQQLERAGTVQLIQEIGGLVGRFLLAFLAVRIISRRWLVRTFQIPGLIIVPAVFIFAATASLQMLQWGIFFAGLLTVAQFSFWGNYLPRVYPTHLRGTGESFSANVGGRMIGTSAALLTTQLQMRMPGESVPTKLAYAAAGTAFLMFAIGLIASFWLPEPKEEDLPE
ncbi:MAG TPA: MFS transporter [Blastocatellia bacterium]|nr:MFS transporter [Blastocatellia bacterium]